LIVDFCLVLGVKAVCGLSGMPVHVQ